MPTPKLPRNAVFITLAVIAGLVGGSIPAFYDWTGSDQSRPSNWLWQVPLGMTVAVVLFSVAIIWIRVESPRRVEPRSPLRFSLRTLLFVQLIGAVVLTLLVVFPTATSGAIIAAAMAYALWFALRRPADRTAVGALLACMYLPYCWIVGSGSFASWSELLRMVAGLPAFFPVALAGAIANTHLEEIAWLAMLLTAVEIVVGLWLIKLGPKRAIVYMQFVLISSAIGSLGLYMLMRA